MDESPMQPEYPRVGARAARHSRKHKVKVWNGDVSKLVALQDYLQDQLELLFRQKIRELGERPESDFDRIRYDSEVTAITQALRLRVHVKGKESRWQHDGEISAVLAEVDDLREIAEIVLENQAYGTINAQVSVTFSDASYAEAVEVEVKGEDPTWVEGVFGGVRDKVTRGQPWWAFMLRPWFGMLTAAGIAAALLTAMIVAWGDVGSTTGSVLWVAWWAGTLGLFALVPWAIRKVLPRLEVVPQGHDSTGGRRLRSAVAILAFIASNIAIPIVIAVVQST